MATGTGLATRAVALFQGDQVLGDVAANLARMKEAMGRAAAAGASLLVFPELFLTGYELSPADVRSLAEEKGGASFVELSEAARTTGVAVLYGYPELDGSGGAARYYNSAQLVDCDGCSLANFRKLHLWTQDSYESAYTPGEAFADVVECCGLKVGILICYDVEFPECTRTLALRGAQVILVPTAVGSKYDISLISTKLIPTFAYVNEVYIGYVNLGGERFAGGSVLCSPAGEELARAEGDSDTLVLAEIQLDSRNLCQCSYLKHRRPQLYAALST